MESTNEVICRSCGAINSQNAEICYKCGRIINCRESRKDYRPIITLVCLILVISVVGVSGYYLWKAFQKNSESDLQSESQFEETWEESRNEYYEEVVLTEEYVQSQIAVLEQLVGVDKSTVEKYLGEAMTEVAGYYVYDGSGFFYCPGEIQILYNEEGYSAEITWYNLDLDELVEKLDMEEVRELFVLAVIERYGFEPIEDQYKRWTYYNWSGVVDNVIGTVNIMYLEETQIQIRFDSIKHRAIR